MITFVFGTRPEALKIGPVVAELRAASVPVRVLCTGQHTTLLEECPALADLRPIESLELPSDGDVTRWTNEAGRRVRAELLAVPPELVVVQGDTMSALVGATAAYELDIPVAHIEAGIRTHADDPWPEEQTRVEIARLAEWHYAPTTQAWANLVAEEVNPNRIHVTGNTVVSALSRYTNGSIQPTNRIVVTLHRREIQNKDKATELASAVLQSAFANPDLDFVWPMHPGFERFIDIKQLGFASNLHVLGPLEYGRFVELSRNAFGILTDSGGLVEEAATFGVPCVILREHNDRPEAEEAGVAVRLDPTGKNVILGVEMLASQQIKRAGLDIYGTPDAAREVAEHLAHLMTEAGVEVN